LIGENGAGKSTLMKILGGAISRDAGTIKIDGEPVEIRSPREASARGIEFIHQELSVLDNLDVAANIFLHREPTTGGWLKLIDRKRVYREADELLRKTGLDLPSRTPLGQLSLAQQQLVEIARALGAGARIIIMDEPTSSLTLTETRRLLEIVKDLKTQNVSVIYISHRMHEVEEIADRAVVLRDGKNAGEIAGGEITHERMVRMMVGRDLKDRCELSGIRSTESHSMLGRVKCWDLPDSSAPADPKLHARSSGSKKQSKPKLHSTAKYCTSTIRRTQSLTAFILCRKIAA
jgi:ribose transport system ATP-binding protein